MRILLDAVIYQLQTRGGISRVYSEVAPRICNEDPSVWFTMLTTGGCRQPLPVHQNIEQRALFPVDDFLRPRRVWGPLLDRARGWVQSQAIGETRDKVWHSTYYTLPRLHRGPIVVTVYDMIHELFPRFFPASFDRFRAQKRECVRSADLVLCISETTKRDLVDCLGIDPRKVSSIPLAAGPVFRRLQDGTATGGGAGQRPYLLYVGGRSAYKNFDTLLAAYERWRHRGEVDIRVVGRPWSRYERSRLSVLDGRRGVLNLGHVTDEELCWLYNYALAFVYPSLYEGFGIPLLEAAACGCPVVASRIPSTVEVLGDGAVYFQAESPDSLTTALGTVLGEQDRSERVALALERVKSYSWNLTATETLAAYRRLAPSVEPA